MTLGEVSLLYVGIRWIGSWIISAVEEEFRRQPNSKWLTDSHRRWTIIAPSFDLNIFPENVKRMRLIGKWKVMRGKDDAKVHFTIFHSTNFTSRRANAQNAIMSLPSTTFTVLCLSRVLLVVFYRLRKRWSSVFTSEQRQPDGSLDID